VSAPRAASARLAAALALGGELPPFVESRIDVGTDRFEYQLHDVDGDRRVDLVVTSASAGERALRLWRQRPDAGFAGEPDFRLTVPPDVVSFALLDVRPEAGDELLLLTRGGVFSLTTTVAGLQGNLRRELSMPLFPDLADARRLPCWRLAKDVDGDGRPELLVVSGSELVALGVEPAGEGGERRLAVRRRFHCGDPARDEARAELEIGGGGITMRARRGLSSIFPGTRSSRPSSNEGPLLARRASLRLPALLDWDGDGRIDLVEIGERAFAVRRQAADGSFAASAESIARPAAIADEPRPGSTANGGGGGATLELRDVDGDGREELIAFKQEGGGANAPHVVLVFPRDAEGRPSAEPSARVKLAGLNVDWEIVDVDRDGRLDLTALVLDVPTGLTTLATIRLDTAFHVFRGRAGATFSRAPDLTFARSFRPEQLSRAQETLLTKIDGDFDQDGVSDLVLTQLDGRVEIRPVTRAGERLVLASKPIASFQPPAPVQRLETWDLSMDGVADLMLRHERGFTLFVSRKGAGR